MRAEGLHFNKRGQNESVSSLTPSPPWSLEKYVYFPEIKKETDRQTDKQKDREKVDPESLEQRITNSEWFNQNPLNFGMVAGGAITS